MPVMPGYANTETPHAKTVLNLPDGFVWPECPKRRQSHVLFDDGYDYRSYEDNENYQLKWNARNPNHAGWVEPLYLAPGAKGE